MPSPLALLASAFVIAVVSAGAGAIVLQQGSSFSHPRTIGGPFTATDLDGRPVTQEDLRVCLGSYCCLAELSRHEADGG